jgi:uncharacterized linocin/CFP29 family protein
MSNGDFWTAAQWAIFNGTPGAPAQGATAAVPSTPGLLQKTMGPIQVAQQVFPTIVTGTDNSISADTIDLKTGIPSTGATRSFATLRKPFQLFPVHVEDPALTMASNQVTLAGQALALVEDMLFFQGREAPLPKMGSQTVNLPPSDLVKLQDGLLGVARSNKVIQVPKGKDRGAWGLATYAAVVAGIADFTSNLQGPPYALIVPPEVFADANFPLPGNAAATAASAIQALLATGQFVMSPGLPGDSGLMASMGGKTTTLYIGTGPLVEYNAYDNSTYSFTARESVQFLNIDPRSLIALEFPKGASGTA